MAVDRMTHCDNIVELAKELCISRRLLFYTWLEKLEPLESGNGPLETSRESILRHELSRPKRVWPENVLELGFSKGALHTIEARRQRSGKLTRRHLRPHSGRDVEAGQLDIVYVNAGHETAGSLVRLRVSALYLEVLTSMRKPILNTSSEDRCMPTGKKKPRKRYRRVRQPQYTYTKGEYHAAGSQ